jgi:hypothetical protein
MRNSCIFYLYGLLYLPFFMVNWIRGAILAHAGTPKSPHSLGPKRAILGDKGAPYLRILLGQMFAGAANLRFRGEKC